MNINRDIKLKKPKAIIFDWDDTLVDTGVFLKGSLNQVIQEMGLTQWSKEAAEKYCHHSLRESFPKIFGDRWEEVRDAYYEKVRQNRPDVVQTLPGAFEAIKVISQNQTLISIVSNKNSLTLNDEVDRLAWRQYFHRVVGATDAVRDKPWPEPVEMALEGVKFDNNDDIWFVGDSIVDVQCAKNTSCIPLLFGHKEESIMQVKQLQIPHVHVSNHDDFISLYKGTLDVV